MSICVLWMPGISDGRHHPLRHVPKQHGALWMKWTICNNSPYNQLETPPGPGSWSTTMLSTSARMLSILWHASRDYYYTPCSLKTHQAR
jgi:hypothetical protein